MTGTEPARAIWQGPPDRLDRVLASLGIARSRSQAADLIGAGRVVVDGTPAAKAGQRVGPGSALEISGLDHYVSRAAHKLRSGLDTFDIDPGGKLALDLGASTGGFTQVLLERGARHVLAIDVGHGQMAEEVREDSRVTLVEGCNARDLTARRLAELTGAAERPSIVVADLSFISLSLIIPAIAQTAADDADLMLLIKPQFEVGRTGVRGGIVEVPELRAEAIRSVLASAAEHGYAARGLARSPIVGGHGNIEYLFHAQRASRPDPTEWEGRIAALSRDGAVESEGSTMSTEGET